MARNVVIFISLGIGIAALFLINIFYGAVSIPFSSVVDALLGCQLPEASWQFIILQSRLPQALTALFAGCALSVCGLMLQAVFRNPLADPSILGISSGAGLGVALVMLLWGGGFAVGSLAVGGFVAVLVAAFIGAFTVTLIMYLLSLVIRSNTMLLIVGVLVGYVSSSFIVLLNFFASQDGVRAYMMWGMGSFSGVPHAMLPVFMITIILCLIVPILLAKPLNLLVLGNKYAENLGVGIRTVRNALLLASGTLTAIVTTLSFYRPCGAAYGSSCIQDRRLPYSYSRRYALWCCHSVGLQRCVCIAWRWWRNTFECGYTFDWCACNTLYHAEKILLDIYHERKRANIISTRTTARAQLQVLCAQSA